MPGHAECVKHLTCWIYLLNIIMYFFLWNCSSKTTFFHLQNLLTDQLCRLEIAKVPKWNPVVHHDK